MSHAYRAADPSGPPPVCPLSLTVSPVHAALRPGAPHGTHVLARIRADRTAPARPRPRLTAVLVLDVSGSMKGDPIAQVIHSAQRVAEILSDGDRLAVVTFNEAAVTISPLRVLDAAARREIRRETSAIFAGGNTNIGGGLAHTALMFPKREPNERQLALLMSDGEPNVGATTPAALLEQARRLKDRDVAISTLGFGASHNDAVLGAIAEGGGGRYAFVVDPKLAESSFVRALGAQLDVVAEQVRLVFAPADGVEIQRVLDDPPTSFGAGGLRVTLPDMIVGDELNVVVELALRVPREGGVWRPLRATLTGTVAGTSHTFSIEDTAAITVTALGPFDTRAEVHAAVSIARAAEMRAEARRHAERGSYPEAAAVLRRAQALIQETPGFVAGAEGPLNDAYETLVDEITVVDQAPKAEDYQRYQKAARDYLDFAQSGAKVRGGGKLGAAAPPSVQALLARARSNLDLPRAFLHVLTGARAGTRMPLDKDRFVIGRARMSADLAVPDVNLSRQHTMVEFLGDGFYVVDMGSTNGTEIAGKRISRHKLADGDTFDVAGNRFRYEEG